MKKILFTAVAILALISAVSCQKENHSGADGELVTVTLTVQAPALESTKALGDGLKATNLVFGVFDKDGNELENLRQGDWMNSRFNAQTKSEIVFDKVVDGYPTTNVKVNLVKGKVYTFICWAQAKEYGEAASPVAVECYDFNKLDAIKVDYTVNNEANNEHRDAFYACVNSGKIKEGHTQKIELRRPFSQLNIGSDDLDEAAKAGLDLSKIHVDLSVSECPTILKADMENEAYTIDGPTTTTFTKALSPASANRAEKLMMKIDEKETAYDWISVNYILASMTKDDELKKVSFNLHEDDLQLVSYTKENVSVKANWRTNLIGRLFTTDSEITIVIDPIFLGEYVVSK